MKASRLLLLKPVNSFEEVLELSEIDDEHAIINNLELIPQFRRCPLFCAESRDPTRARLVIKVIYHYMNRPTKEGIESANSSWFWYCTECFQVFIAQDITRSEHKLQLDSGKVVVQISEESHPAEFKLLQSLGKRKTARLRGGINRSPKDSRISY